MADHSHWWTFCFYTEPQTFYFTELPCGAGEREIGIEMARIVSENVDVFREQGTGKCVPRMMPPELDHCPEGISRRLVTRADVKSFGDSEGKLA